MSGVTFDSIPGGTPVASGSTIDGTTFTFSAGGFSGVVTGTFLAVSPPNTLGVLRDPGNPGSPQNTFGAGESVTLDFPQPVQAIGAYFSTGAAAGTTQGFLSVATPVGTALSGDALPGGTFGFPDNTLRFIGLTSATPFTQATLAIANPSPGNVTFVADSIIVGHLADSPEQTLTGGGPGGSQFVISNLGGTDNGLPTGGICANILGLTVPGLTVVDASLGNQGDAFDNGLTLWVNDTIFVAPPSVTRIGQTYTAGPVTIADLAVTMQYYAASQSGTLRTFVSFTNPTGGDITVTVKWLTNVGSDSNTQVVGSSNGDPAFTEADRWVITSDSGQFDAVNTHVLFGPGNPPVTPSLVSQVVFGCFGQEGIFAQYSLTVPAGQTRALLFFNQLNPTADIALASAATFDSSTLTDDLLAGLNTSERGQIRNWLLVAPPDLVVLSIVLFPPSPTIGQPVTATVTVQNPSNTDVTDLFFVDFYKDLATPPGTGQFGDAYCSFDGVAANTTVQCVQTVTYDLAGTFQAWAQVDADGFVAESNETNNVLGPQNVTVQSDIPAGPDLLIVGVTFFPAAPVAGQPVTVTVIARNQGATPAGAFALDIYRNLASPPVPNQSGQASCVFGGLAPDATVPCVRDVTYPQAGAFQLWAQVDTNGQVNEGPNENNNLAGPVPIIVGAPPPRLFTLTVSVAGGGAGVRVISLPGGIDCTPDCQETYGEGTQILLAPVIPSGSGSAFLGFSQNCAGAIVLTQDTLCVATFVQVGALLVSVGAGGAVADGRSENPVVSADGRFLAFDSDASNLDAEGTCAGGIIRQIFLVDLDTGRITCASVGRDGGGNLARGNLDSTRPSISQNGQFVAFQSRANNLDPNACPLGGTHIYVHDRLSRATTCVSVTPSGFQGNADSELPAMSANGRFVAFESLASDLVPDCGGTKQILVRDLQLNVTSCGSVGAGGVAGNRPSSVPSINQDGTVLAFESVATNLVQAGCTLGGASQIFYGVSLRLPICKSLIRQAM